MLIISTENNISKIANKLIVGIFLGAKTTGTIKRSNHIRGRVQMMGHFYLASLRESSGMGLGSLVLILSQVLGLGS